MYDDIFDPKNTQTFPISLGLPPRFNGIELYQDLSVSSDKFLVISVSMKPGATTLHLIFLEPSSNAIDFVKPIIPAFEAE